MPSMAGPVTGEEGIHTNGRIVMSILSEFSKTMLAATVAGSFIASAIVAQVATKIRVQSLISAKAMKL